jgi:phage shock protein PspC (stress-responsive transcriptional regulator)
MTSTAALPPPDAPTPPALPGRSESPTLPELPGRTEQPPGPPPVDPPGPPQGPPPGSPPPPPGPPGSAGSPPPVGPRLLRRSDRNRVAAGVAGGLGEYFGVDPVLFRVLFAVGAFFGGAGILAYIIAWAAIPERGAPHAPVDRLIGGGRRSNVPVWILTVAGVFVVWALFFSWWAPWRFLSWTFLPLTLTAVVLAVALSRRPAAPLGPSHQWPSPQGPSPQGPTPAVAPPADATTAQVGTAGAGAVDPGATEPPAWVVEARERRQEQRRRKVPVRWATFALVILSVVGVAIVDANVGIAIPVYFAAIQFALIAGVVAGAILRRPIWWATLFLIPGAIGLFAFAGCRVSLHDGSGDNAYTPKTTAQLKDNYRNAFGRTTFDLTELARPGAAQTVHVRLGAGQVRLIVPPSLPVNVHADIHLGDVRLDGNDDGARGMGVHNDPLTTTSGKALTIYVQISAGELEIDRSP